MATDLSKKNILELVAEQRALASKCLEVGRAIEKRLETEGAGSAGALPPSRNNNPASDLAEPLLPAAKQERSASKDSVNHGHPQESHSIFPDVDAVKKLLKGNLTKDEYCVEDCYHKDGFFPDLARNDTFGNITLGVIFLNVIWIGIDTDTNKAELLINAEPIFQVAENFFCCFFSFEIFTRFMAFRRKADAFKDGWFCFDFTLVSLMVWEVWIMTGLSLLLGASSSGPLGNTTILRVFRLFRLARASRVVRLLKFFPELLTLLNAMVAAMRAVAGTLALLVIILYVFAILFTQLMSGDDAAKDCFETVPQSMNCLLGQGVFPDQTSKMDDLLKADWVYFTIFLVFLCIVTLMVLNLLIGVLCEVVGTVAEAESESVAVSYLKSQIRQVIQLIDVDGDDGVSRDEFRSLIQNKDAASILSDVDVDVYALVDFADFIFGEKTVLSLDDFVATILQFRGDNAATVKDVVDLRKSIAKELRGLEQRLSKA